MRKLIPIIILSALLGSCSNIKNIPQKEETVTHYIDSIAWHDSTIYHHIYKEHYKDYVNPDDTLNLETEYSKFKAWNDTTNKTLKGEAINKEGSIPTKIKWKEKIVYKDSIQVKEVPVEVEKPVEVKYIPKFFWVTFIFSILFIIYLVIKLILKLKK